MSQNAQQVDQLFISWGGLNCHHCGNVVVHVTFGKQKLQVNDAITPALIHWNSLLAFTRLIQLATFEG